MFGNKRTIEWNYHLQYEHSIYLPVYMKTSTVVVVVVFYYYIISQKILQTQPRQNLQRVDSNA